jgi:ketosteroid isomerase-like protein
MERVGMMKVAISTLGILLLCGSALAQPKPAAAGDEAALRAIEEKWDSASLKGDVAALGAIYADSFVTTDTDGKVRTKAEVLARVKSGEVKYSAAKADDLKIYVYGDAAVVNGRWTGKFTENGKPMSAVERFTDTFVRQNGQWRCVASHSSTIK